MNLARLNRIELRHVWKHEALSFTPWLQENLDLLSEAIGLSLTGAEREQAAGAFSVDLVATDEAGNRVIIENQLERTNHDHLGKLITYLVAYEARAAVWIVAEARPEHVHAVSWLNEATDTKFYLVKVEAVQIADSPPAPLFTVIVGPSEEQQSRRILTDKLNERARRNHEFWQQLLERARSRTPLHANVSPRTDHWIAAGAGRDAMSFNYVILTDSARVSLVIGTPDAERNKAIFNRLQKAREQIERAFGDTLEWQALEGKKACRICKNLDVGGIDDRDRWPQIQDAMIDAMVRLEHALRPHIDKLDL